jgi:hypothetical protein
MELCAESFARGIKANIIYYTRSFVNASNQEVRTLNEFKILLEQALLPHSRISVELSVYNAGQTAVAIRPHMALKILHDNFRNKAFILAVQTRGTLDTAEEHPKSARTRAGQEVLPESFLPETSPSPYISVPPGEMKQILLTAVEPLGRENGETLKRIYQTSLLTCRIVGVTLNDKRVWSTSATFSNEIGADERDRLTKAVIAA